MSNLSSRIDKIIKDLSPGKMPPLVIGFKRIGEDRYVLTNKHNLKPYWSKKLRNSIFTRKKKNKIYRKLKWQRKGANQPVVSVTVHPTIKD